jgi:hypothetical protein
MISCLASITIWSSTPSTSALPTSSGGVTLVYYAGSASSLELIQIYLIDAIILSVRYAVTSYRILSAGLWICILSDLRFLPVPGPEFSNQN